MTRRASTFAKYADARLDELLDDRALASARRLTVDQLQSGVLLSRADGTFSFSPLPREAQIAPIFGLVAGDLDGDGKADVCVLMNSCAPVPENGPFNGGVGQLLAGDGAGGFRAVPASASGIVVAGDAKALVRLDFDGDGWPDLFGSRNDGLPVALRNRPEAGRHMFAVRFAAQVGRTLAGARAEVTLQDGTRQLGEISIGGGYLSQSSTDLFFGYADGNPPRRVEVFWPDGRRVDVPWQEGAVLRVLDGR